MRSDQLNQIVAECIENIEETLTKKGEEYSRKGDRLHNFKRAAILGQTTSAEALLGMKIKHDISILDMIEDLKHNRVHDKDTLDEKFGDAINYLILLKAILIEEYENA